MSAASNMLALAGDCESNAQSGLALKLRRTILPTLQRIYVNSPPPTRAGPSGGRWQRVQAGRRDCRLWLLAVATPDQRANLLTEAGGVRCLWKEWTDPLTGCLTPRQSAAHSSDRPPSPASARQRRGEERWVDQHGH